MALRNRHRPVDPDCPHGGPPLSDSMMEYVYNRLEWLEKTAWERLKNKGVAIFKVAMTHSPMPGEEKGDFSTITLGCIRAYAHRMKGHIEDLEAEILKSPIFGVDPKKLEGKTIFLVEKDKIIFTDRTMLVRNWLNWEWIEEKPDSNSPE